MLALGARNLPVVARGAQFVLALNTAALLDFLGVPASAAPQALPPRELVARWVRVLRAAQRYARQIPDDAILGRVLPHRDRSIRLLAHHIFRIGEAYCEVVAEGVELTDARLNRKPEEGTLCDGRQIAAYGDAVIARIEAWWSTVRDETCPEAVATYYGRQTVHQLLERSTWHSAQHVRQLLAVVERLGITPQGPLAAEDLAGLPLPERLWE